MKFRISRKLDTIKTVTAKTYDDAADKFARSQYGRKAVARRTAGDNDKSGYFQAYEPMKGGGLNSIGEPFHLFPLN